MQFVELVCGNTDTFYSEDLQEELKNAIAKLKQHYRDIIIAIDFEGYCMKEIALETEIPQGTIMSKRHRGLSIF
ncbi:MAG TPA: hypothetical protein ENH87_05835 [Pricia antarctica]|uniref:RNA polymerase sigma factor 70 region 4 type 2 domain-containing protein n=1 Tax=Pricia antarctica TaxID=641691 RepID=A0A831QPK4_9FLAO|nr:hypothetical protein [Pricia antarctica]